MIIYNNRMKTLVKNKFNNTLNSLEIWLLKLKNKKYQIKKMYKI